MNLIPAACPACADLGTFVVEKVTSGQLAMAWSKEGLHGRHATAQSIAQLIEADLKTDCIEFRRCSVCALEFASPMLSWTALNYPNQRHELGFDHQFALNRLATLRPLRILEIGCGDGAFLYHASTLGHHAVGIDFSSAAIAEARTRGVDARVADVSAMSKLVGKADLFDAIAMFQVIEHLVDPDDTFKQIGVLANSNAMLFIGCPSPRRYTRAYGHSQRLGLSDFWDYPPQHTLRWTVPALLSFLKRHGWTIELIAFEPLLPMAMAAHMSGIEAADPSSPRGALWRRARTAWWLFRGYFSKAFFGTTGIRLALVARRNKEGTMV